MNSDTPTSEGSADIEGLLFSGPCVCGRRIVAIELFVPPRGTESLLLLLFYLALVLKLFVNVFVFESLGER